MLNRPSALGATDSHFTVTPGVENYPVLPIKA